MAKDSVENSPDARKHVYEAILGATLLFLVDSLPPGAPNGGLILGASELVFPFGKKDTGETYTTAFTGEDSLRAWDPMRPFVRLKAQTLFRMIQSLGLDEVWINLFHERRMLNPGGWLSRREIEVLAAGKVPERVGPHHSELQVAESDKVEIKAPTSRLSSDVQAALLDCTRDLREVCELVFFQISINGEAGHHAIGLGLEPDSFPGQVEPIMQKIISIVHPLLGDRGMLDVMPYAVPNPELSEKGVIIFRRG